MKYHINNDYEVRPCGATEEGRCPFYGQNGSSNHYANEAEAITKAEEILSTKHNVNEGRSKAPTEQFKKNKEFISEALVEYGSVKSHKDLQDVSNVKEMINEWFSGDREKYNGFRKLIADEGFTEETKKSVAHLILRGLPVQKRKSVYDISSETDNTNKENEISEVTILEDFTEQIDLENIRKDNKFSFFNN